MVSVSVNIVQEVRIACSLLPGFISSHGVLDTTIFMFNSIFVPDADRFD